MSNQMRSNITHRLWRIHIEVRAHSFKLALTHRRTKLRKGRAHFCSTSEKAFLKDCKVLWRCAWRDLILPKQISCFYVSVCSMSIFLTTMTNLLDTGTGQRPVNSDFLPIGRSPSAFQVAISWTRFAKSPTANSIVDMYIYIEKLNCALNLVHKSLLLKRTVWHVVRFSALLQDIPHRNGSNLRTLDRLRSITKSATEVKFV